MRRTKRASIGWHVIARGARRLDLFKDNQDFLNFLAILRFALIASGSTLWAFTLMSNHYHLVIRASTTQLTACMRRVNRTYSRYHNRKYGLVGHAFDGPYKAYAQPTAMLLLRTIAYVFMNPVTAGLSRHPEDWQWSSVREYLGMPGSVLRVNPQDVMHLVSTDPAKAWAAFHTAMERELKRPKRVVADQLSRTQLHAQQFEWLLEHAREIESQLQGEDATLVALYWARNCGITPKAIALVLEDRSSHQVSQSTSKFAARLRKNPTLARVLAIP